MVRHIIVFTADKRQEKLVHLLEGEKTNGAWRDCSYKKEASERIYVLPIPVTKLDNNPEIKEKLKRELIRESSASDINLKVFGGVMNTEWKSFLDGLGISWWDFMKLPEVVEGNAWITAEATVAEVLQRSECSIAGQKMLVMGYGCCGSKIANLMAKLGAEVIVAARREEVRSQVKKDGFKAIAFEDLKEKLTDVSTVINTVPSLVLTEDRIQKMPSNSLIVDIASKPGGTDFDAAQKYGVDAKLALGLPGIYTTKSSALLLKNAISKYAPFRQCVSEEKLWIFQVVI